MADPQTILPWLAAGVQALGLSYYFGVQHARSESQKEKTVALENRVAEAEKKQLELRKDLIDEMRREDGRVSTIDGERHGDVRSVLEHLTERVDKGFEHLQVAIRVIATRVAENQGAVELLARQAQKSDPKFKVPKFQIAEEEPFAAPPETGFRR